MRLRLNNHHHRLHNDDDEELKKNGPKINEINQCLSFNGWIGLFFIGLRKKCTF